MSTDLTLTKTAVTLYGNLQPNVDTIIFDSEFQAQIRSIIIFAPRGEIVVEFYLADTEIGDFLLDKIIFNSAGTAENLLNHMQISMNDLNENKYFDLQANVKIKLVLITGIAGVNYNINCQLYD